MYLGRFLFTIALTFLGHLYTENWTKTHSQLTAKKTHNQQMNTVIVFASLELIELLEDGERVPTKVAQTQQSYHLDSYTKDWYEDKKKALEQFGLSQYLISNLLRVALSATMDTISYSRAAALYSLRRQKTTTLTDKEVDNILHILFWAVSTFTRIESATMWYSQFSF